MKTRTKPSTRYDGRVAVVTGASSGLGRRFCVDLAGRGATVIGLARRAGLLAELSDTLRALSPSSSTQVCDVSAPDDFGSQLHEIEQRHGRIDILVNDAGIDIVVHALEARLDTFREVFEVNFFAAVTGTLAVVPGMVARHGGIVVNVSSDSARAPEPGQGAYSASKAALANFTEALAHELAPQGVMLHVLYPAWVPTAMGLSGNEDGGSLPPKAVRRTEEQVSSLLLERMGGERIDINAALLPLLAPISRTIAPRSYQKAMRRLATTNGPR
jgi:NAD(P)-dependent dehydrogenase (short-subunit alcohol dehydrogenase family)